MPIPVLLFASLRSRFGNQVQLDIEPPTSVDAIRDKLRAGDVWTTGARIAVNHRFADDTHTVGDGDEVAVIPPVSGG